MSTNPTSISVRSLRVAQLIESLHMGGAEHLAVNIANHLAGAGHESHLIVPWGEGVLSAKVRPEVHVHYLNYRRASIGNPLAFLFSLRKGVRLIGRVVQKHDIQVVQTHLPGANFFGLLLAWRKTCAVLATIHNNQEFHYGDTDNKLLGRARRWAYRRILRATQGVVAVSNEVKDSLVAELKADPAEAERIFVTTNAVALPDPIPAERVAAIRERLGCRPQDVFLLAAGRFCEQKNFGDLVAVAAGLRDAGCAFHLVIAGDGEQRADLTARFAAEGLADEVTLPGNLTDLDDVMQAADTFVMTSLWEGLPLVLLEAMAAGLPVVAYGIPGVTAVVRAGETGRLAPVGRPEVLAELAADLAGDETLRSTMGAAGRERIRAEYGFAEYVDILLGRYEEAVQAMGKEPK